MYNMYDCIATKTAIDWASVLEPFVYCFHSNNIAWRLKVVSPAVGFHKPISNAECLPHDIVIINIIFIHCSQLGIKVSLRQALLLFSKSQVKCIFALQNAYEAIPKHLAWSHASKHQLSV